MLEVLPQQMSQRPPSNLVSLWLMESISIDILQISRTYDLFFFVKRHQCGRSDLETIMLSKNCADWIKLSEMLLGTVPEGFLFEPKHKGESISYWIHYIQHKSQCFLADIVISSKKKNKPIRTPKCNFLTRVIWNQTEEVCGEFVCLSRDQGALDEVIQTVSDDFPSLITIENTYSPPVSFYVPRWLIVL